MRMLNIIYSYLCGREDINTTINPLVFIAIFENVINVTDDFNRAVNDILNKNAVRTLIEKHRVLDLLNHCTPKRSIYSMSIEKEVHRLVFTVFERFQISNKKLIKHFYFMYEY